MTKTILENKIEELLQEIEIVQFFGEPVVQKKYVAEKMKELARWSFNQFYPDREATDEVEPWAEKGRQEQQGHFANGFNSLRDEIKETAFRIGVLTKL